MWLKMLKLPKSPKTNRIKRPSARPHQIKPHLLKINNTHTTKITRKKKAEAGTISINDGVFAEFKRAAEEKQKNNELENQAKQTFKLYMSQGIGLDVSMIKWHDEIETKTLNLIL